MLPMAEEQKYKPDDVDLAKISTESFLFLIDCSTAMNDGGDACVLNSVFQTIADSMRSLAIHNSVHTLNFGLVLYNVDTFNHCKILNELRPLNATDLKRLIRLATKDFRDQHFVPAKPHAEAIINALSIAKAEISRVRMRSLFRLVIVTNNDNPVDRSAKLLNLAQVCMSDLCDLRVITMPIFVPPVAHVFSGSKFWNKLVYTPPAMTEYESRLVQFSTFLNSENKDFKSGLERAISGVLKQPFVRHGVLRLGNADIGVCSCPVYVKKPAKLMPATLATFEVDGKITTEILNTEYVYYSKATGEKLDPHESVPSPDEIANEGEGEFQEYGSENGVYEIMSFVSTENLHSLLGLGTIGTAKLVFPSNDRIEHSSAIFSSLYRTMRAQQVSAVVLLHSEHGLHVQGILYACDPEDGWEYNQNGLAFVRIPYEDDIRVSQNERDSDAHEADYCPELEMMVSKMNMKTYNPNKFKSPMRAQNEHVLECHALGMAMEDQYEIPDATIPMYDSMKRYIGNTTTSLAHKFLLNTHYLPKGEASGAKRMKVEHLD